MAQDKLLECSAENESSPIFSGSLPRKNLVTALNENLFSWVVLLLRPFKTSLSDYTYFRGDSKSKI